MPVWLVSIGFLWRNWLPPLSVARRGAALYLRRDCITPCLLLPCSWQSLAFCIGRCREAQGRGPPFRWKRVRKVFCRSPKRNHSTGFYRLCCSRKGEVGMSRATEEVYSLLNGQFRGNLLRPGHTEFSEARRIWNGMVARTPSLIARCAGVPDVQAALRTASAAGVFPSIRCGGPSLLGFVTSPRRPPLDLHHLRHS